MNVHMWKTGCGLQSGIQDATTLIFCRVDSHKESRSGVSSSSQREFVKWNDGSQNWGCDLYSGKYSN